MTPPTKPDGVYLRLEQRDVSTLLGSYARASTKKRKLSGDRWTLGPTWHREHQERFNADAFYPYENDAARTCTIEQAKKWAADQIAMTTDMVVTGWTDLVDDQGRFAFPELSLARYGVEIVMSDGHLLVATIGDRKAAESLVAKLYETNGVLHLPMAEDTLVDIPARHVVRFTRRIVRTPVPNLALGQLAV